MPVLDFLMTVLCPYTITRTDKCHMTQETRLWVNECAIGKQDYDWRWGEVQGRRVDLPSNSKHTWEKRWGGCWQTKLDGLQTHFTFFKHAKLISTEVFLSHHSAFIQILWGIAHCNSLVHVPVKFYKKRDVNKPNPFSTLSTTHTHKCMKICCVYLVPTWKESSLISQRILKA